jgi:hypothetical protein
MDHPKPTSTRITAGPLNGDPSRLRQQLADEKTVFESAQAVKLADADRIAQKEQDDAVAVANAEEADALQRRNADFASRLESIAASGGWGDIGTVADRLEALTYFDVTDAALSRAAAHPVSPWFTYEDPTPDYGRSTEGPPPEQVMSVISALIRLRSSARSVEEQAEAHRLREQRERVLADEADRLIRERIETTQAMEA